MTSPFHENVVREAAKSTVVPFGSEMPRETRKRDELRFRSALERRSGNVCMAKTPNDPSSATRPARALDCNLDAMAGFAAAHG